MCKEIQKIYDEQNGIRYVKNGDYYVSELELPEENRSIGKYGRMHREYLGNSNPILFDDLVLTCRLWTYLADVNEQAQERLQVIVEQMKESESVTEELKEKEQMEWYRRMLSIRDRAEEIVLNELIYL